MVNNETKVLTSRKSISDSSSQTLFSAEPVTAGNTSAFAGYTLIDHATASAQPEEIKCAEVACNGIARLLEEIAITSARKP